MESTSVFPLHSNTHRFLMIHGICMLPPFVLLQLITALSGFNAVYRMSIGHSCPIPLTDIAVPIPSLKGSFSPLVLCGAWRHWNNPLHCHWYMYEWSLTSAHLFFASVLDSCKLSRLQNPHFQRLVWQHGRIHSTEQAQTTTLASYRRAHIEHAKMTVFASYTRHTENSIWLLGEWATETLYKVTHFVNLTLTYSTRVLSGLAWQARPN